MAIEPVWSALRGEGWRFDLLVEIQVMAFLLLGLTYAFIRKHPTYFSTDGRYLVPLTFWGWTQVPFDFFRLDYLDLATPLLVPLLIGAAVAAVCAVGHSLARSDYLR